MDALITYDKVGSKLPVMLVAFAGWPDAAEAATRALQHMVSKLHAKKFAEIDTEEFFDFTVTRPYTKIGEDGERVVSWPANDFYFHAPDEESNGILFYIGTEPNLKWRTFSDLILTVAQEHGVKLVVSLGALMDAVPHTREPRVTGVTSSSELRQKAEWLGIRDSKYQGSTGIHLAFLTACIRAGLKHASLWGHSPHYINNKPNPQVSLALLEKLRTLVHYDVDLGDLVEAGRTFETEVTKVVSKQQEMVGYIRQLENRYDKCFTPIGEIPSPEAMVEELEQFLRSQREGSDGAEEV